jgi:hypothetical protein
MIWNDDGSIIIEPSDVVLGEVLKNKEAIIQQEVDGPGIAIDVTTENGHESIRTLRRHIDRPGYSE